MFLHQFVEMTDGQMYLNVFRVFKCYLLITNLRNILLLNILFCDTLCKKEHRVFPSCSLRNIDSRPILRARHLLLVDLTCRNVTGASDRCLAGESHITYRCVNGFKFATNQGSHIYINENFK